MERMTGLSTNGKQVTPELFRAYAAAGIGAAELSLAQEDYAAFPYREAARWAKEAGVRLWSFHLPFLPFVKLNAASLDAGVRAHTVEELGRYIRLAADLGIGRVVIHPSGEPNAPEHRAEQIKAAQQTLAALAEVASRAGTVLCVEDLPRTCLGNCAAEMATLLQADGRLRVCFDTNHLLGEDPVDFVRALGPMIETVHVSDYDFVDERHWLPGEGCIDWPALLDALDAAGYVGPWLYEVAFAGDPATVDRERDLCCADFARNAAELAARAPLTHVGMGKRGLSPARYG